jgi:hypothetical protein
MITFGRTCTALITMIAAILPAVTVGAAEPTLSDIAGCNQEAAQRTGASALPAPPGAAGPEVAKRAPDGSREPRELPAHGGVPVAGAPGARIARPGDNAAPSAEKTDPSGAVITQSPDPLLKGMDAEKANDAAYRTAYRECMRSKIAR